MGVTRHIGDLEAAGLVETWREGKVKRLQITTAGELRLDVRQRSVHRPSLMPWTAPVHDQSGFSHRQSKHYIGAGGIYTPVAAGRKPRSGLKLGVHDAADINAGLVARGGTQDGIEA